VKRFLLICPKKRVGTVPNRADRIQAGSEKAFGAVLSRFAPQDPTMKRFFDGRTKLA
jgi:hypothetical protein